MNTEVSYGVLPNLINKPSSEIVGRNNTHPVDTSSDIAGLAELIKSGKAFTLATFGGDKRNKKNVKAVQLLALDFDNKGEKTLTIPQALENGYIKNKACLIYTSPSHTEQHHRYRVVFQLERGISGDLAEFALEKFITEFEGLADEACSTPQYFFYGNTNAQIQLLKQENFITNAEIESLQAEFEVYQQKQQQKKEEAANNIIDIPANLERDAKLVLKALQKIPPRRPGSNTYHESFKVFAGLIHHFGKEKGLEIARQWSPENGAEGSGWEDLDKKADGVLARDGENNLGLGTVLKIAQDDYDFDIRAAKRELGFPTSIKNLVEYPEFTLEQFLNIAEHDDYGFVLELSEIADGENFTQEYCWEWFGRNGVEITVVDSLAQAQALADLPSGQARLAIAFNLAPNGSSLEQISSALKKKIVKGQPVTLLPSAGWQHDVPRLATKARFIQEALGVQPEVLDLAQALLPEVSIDNPMPLERAVKLSWSDFQNKYAFLFQEQPSVTQKKVEVFDYRWRSGSSEKRPQKGSVEFKKQSTIFIASNISEVQANHLAREQNICLISIPEYDWESYQTSVFKQLKTLAPSYRIPNRSRTHLALDPADFRIVYLPKSGEIDNTGAFGKSWEVKGINSLEISLSEFIAGYREGYASFLERLLPDKKIKLIKEYDKKQLALHNLANEATEEYDEDSYQPITTLDQVIGVINEKLNKPYTVGWWEQYRLAEGDTQKQLHGDPNQIIYPFEFFCKRACSYLKHWEFNDYRRQHQKRYFRRSLLQESQDNLNPQKIAEYCTSKGWKVDIHNNSEKELGEIVDFWMDYQSGLYAGLSLMGSGKTKSLEELSHQNKIQAEYIGVLVERILWEMGSEGIPLTEENVYANLLESDDIWGKVTESAKNWNKALDSLPKPDGKENLRKIEKKKEPVKPEGNLTDLTFHLWKHFGQDNPSALYHHLQKWGISQFFITGRRNLNLQSSEITKIPTRERLKQIGKHSHQQSLCPESIQFITPEMAIGATFILDEAESNLKNIFTSSTLAKVKDGWGRGDKLHHFFSLLKIALSTGGRVILLDANLDIRTLERFEREIAIHEINCNKTFIYNEYLLPDTWDCEFVWGTKKKLAAKSQSETTTKEPKTKSAAQLKKEARLQALGCLAGINEADYSCMVLKIAKEIREGGIPFIATDSRNIVDFINEYLSTLFPDKVGLTITSRKNGKEQKEFLKDPDKYLAEHKPAWVAVSPSVESGISITSDYFSKVFGVFLGVITPNVALQMLGRVRKPVPRVVWAAVQPSADGGLKSENNFDVFDDGWLFNPQKILRNAAKQTNYGFQSTKVLGIVGNLANPEVRDMIESNRKTAIDSVLGEVNSAPVTVNQIWAEIVADNNKEKFLFRDEVLWRLRAGYSKQGARVVTINDSVDVDKNEEFEEQWKEVKVVVRRERARKLAAVVKLPEEKLKRLRQKEGDLSEEEMLQLERDYLDQIFNNEIALTEDIIYEYYTKDDGRMLRQLKLKAQVDELVSALKLKQKEQYSYLSSAKSPLYLADVPKASAKHLTDLGLKLFTDCVFSEKYLAEAVRNQKPHFPDFEEELDTSDVFKFVEKLASKIGGELVEVSGEVVDLKLSSQEQQYQKEGRLYLRGVKKYRIKLEAEELEGFEELYKALRRRVVAQGEEANKELKERVAKIVPPVTKEVCKC